MSDALLEDLKLLYAHEIKRSKNPEFLIDLLRRIAFLTAERDQYKDRCERLERPVSDEEVHNFASLGENGFVFIEEDIDRIIAARSKEETNG